MFFFFVLICRSLPSLISFILPAIAVSCVLPVLEIIVLSPATKGNTSQVPQMGSIARWTGFLKQSKVHWGGGRGRSFLCTFWSQKPLVWVEFSNRTFWEVLQQLTPSTICSAFWCKGLCVPLQTLSALQDPKDFLYTHFFNSGKLTGDLLFIILTCIFSSFFFFFTPFDTPPPL